MSSLGKSLEIMVSRIKYAIVFHILLLKILAFVVKLSDSSCGSFNLNPLLDGERGRKTDLPKLYAYNEGEHSVVTLTMNTFVLYSLAAKFRCIMSIIDLQYITNNGNLQRKHC